MPVRYPALKMLISFLKIISVVFIVAGFGVSAWFLFQDEANDTTLIISIGGIVFSIVYGVIIYALSDFFRCVIDIEANTRIKSEKTQNST